MNLSGILLCVEVMYNGKDQKNLILETLYCDIEQAKETVMMHELLRTAREFYANPKNREAFEKWLAEKESKSSKEE